MRVLGLITARGGSRGIPGKNLKPLAGRPLIAHTIEAARASLLECLLVSTDHDGIARTSLELGAEVPFRRPADLARDDSSPLDAVIHAIQWMQDHEGRSFDYVMLLQPTSPFRTSRDIDSVIDLARHHPVDAVVSVCPTPHHPYLARRINDDGILEPFFDSARANMRRQEMGPAYVLNGAIYLNSTDSLLNERTFFPERTLAYVMPPERSLDIDTPWDFFLAELIGSAQARGEGFDDLEDIS